MKQKIEFIKIEATGNDFICLDGRDTPAEILSAEKIFALCDRRRGIGGDGLIYLSVEQNAEVRMRYFNADGSRGEMCGNGLRAATLLAVDRGILKADTNETILADDGEHRVFFRSREHIEVEIFYRPESYSSTEKDFDVPDNTTFWGYLNTGVPHVVLEVSTELTDEFVIQWGKHLRCAEVFQPQGANVNFIRKLSEDEIFVRTYERGVEAETLSCGSGVTACAILFWKKFSVKDGVLHVRTRGGELIVSRTEKRICLQGPARIVFEGILN